MRLSKEVDHFSRSCEHLIAEADMGDRKLTDEEILLVEYYCREVLEKVAKRPPSQQPQKNSPGSRQQRSNIPPSETSQGTIRPSALA